MLSTSPDAECSRVCTISSTIRTSSDAVPGTEHLEHVTGRHPFGAAPVDEQDLLRPSQLVDVPLSHEPALEAPLHRGRPYESRVLERLERHRQVAVVDSAELHDHVRQHLPGLYLRHARYPHRHHHTTPTGDVAVDARDQQ